MPQSLSRILIHVIFSTKNREPLLLAPALRQEMHAFLGGVANKLKAPPIQIGGVADHVHLLLILPRTLTVADLVKELKRVSTNWIAKEAESRNPDFRWQAGYGVFSVSESRKDVVAQYIQNQEEHHRTRSFQDEFRGFCKRHGVEIDERYVWE